MNLTPYILLAAISPAPAAQVDRSFTVTMAVRPDTPEGQSFLFKESQRRCAPLVPQAGRYRFEGSERLGTNKPKPAKWKVQQALVCGSASPPVAAPSAADPAWRPTAEIEKAIIDTTNRYFALVDAADGPNAHAFWSASNQEMVPLERRQAELSRVKVMAGKPLGHRILKLTWYVNPEGAPVPGIYVAADYEKDYGNLAANCGYLVWFRQPDGRFVIVREETGFLTKEQAGKMSSGDLAEARAGLRCPPA